MQMEIKPQFKGKEMNQKGKDPGGFQLITDRHLD